MESKNIVFRFTDISLGFLWVLPSYFIAPHLTSCIQMNYKGISVPYLQQVLILQYNIGWCYLDTFTLRK